MSDRAKMLLRFGGLAGLLLSMGLVLYLVARSRGGPTTQSSALPESVQTQLQAEGVAAPVALPNDPRAAAGVLAQQECVIPCQAEFSGCRSTAEDPAAEQRCQGQLDRCRDACAQPAGAPPAAGSGRGGRRGL